MTLDSTGNINTFDTCRACFQGDFFPRFLRICLDSKQIIKSRCFFSFLYGSPNIEALKGMNFLLSTCVIDFLGLLFEFLIQLGFGFFFF